MHYHLVIVVYIDIILRDSAAEHAFGYESDE